MFSEIKNARNVNKEQAFNLNIKANEVYDVETDDTVMIQGVIDLFYINSNGELVLVDYKTDRCAAAELPGKYGEQIRWYARALREITEYPVAECWLYGLYEGAAVPVSVM